MGKKKGNKGLKRDNTAKMARVAANKERKKLKYAMERDKRKGTESVDSYILVCGCGKTVKVRRYICKQIKDGKETDGIYKCATCRGIRKYEKTENTSDKQPKDRRHGKGTIREKN